MPVTHQPRSLNPDSRMSLVILAALVALGPLTVDMYLPAMPAMQRAFDTDIARMHLTLSAYLWGFALFHLVCGPLADRYGRRPLLLGGTALFVLASAGCALSQSVEQLIVFRFVQGLGACVGPTLARTITRDVFGPRGAARALSLIAMIMACAPALAPGIGGVMLRFAPWPSVFVFLGAYGVMVLWIVARRIPETLPAPQSLAAASIMGNYLQLLRDRVFFASAIGGGLLYAGLTAYLASSGFIFIDMFGVPVHYFGLIFIPTVMGYMTGSALSARLSAHRTPEQVMYPGAVLGLGATASMLILQTLAPQSMLPIIVCITLYAASLGLVMPNAMALSLEHFPLIAGTAASLFGFLQMALAAGLTGAVGAVLTDSPVPMIVTLLVATVAALLMVLRARSAVQRNDMTSEQELHPQHQETTTP